MATGLALGGSGLARGFSFVGIFANAAPADIPPLNMFSKSFNVLLAKLTGFLFLNVFVSLHFLRFLFFFKLCFLTLYNFDILPLVNFISI